MTNVFYKIKCVLELTNTYFPNKDFEEIKHMLGRIYHFRQGRNVKLVKEEFMLEDLLVQKNLKPSTVYKWFLLDNVDDDIRDRLEKGRISMRKAVGLRNQRKEEQSKDFGNKILLELSAFVKEVCSE